MPAPIRGARAPQSLDGLIADFGLIAAADEGAEAQAAQIRASEHRLAANAQRAKIEAQHRRVKAAQSESAKPTIFSRALSLAGRAFAAVATNAYSIAIEVGTSSKWRPDRAHAGFSIFAMAMSPLAGMAALVADRWRQADRAKGIVRAQVELERTGIALDRFRKAMAHDLELAKAAGDRGGEAREDVAQMIDALDAASRSAARSIGG